MFSAVLYYNFGNTNQCINEKNNSDLSYLTTKTQGGHSGFKVMGGANDFLGFKFAISGLFGGSFGG